MVCSVSGLPGGAERSEGEQGGHLCGPGAAHGMRPGPQAPLCRHHPGPRATSVTTHTHTHMWQNALTAPSAQLQYAFSIIIDNLVVVINTAV